MRSVIVRYIRMYKNMASLTIDISFDKEYF
jgi:hypothetical protein